MATPRSIEALALVAALATAVAAAPVGAASFDEAVRGDMSGDGLAPSTWSLNFGANTLAYSVRGSPRDLDYLRVDLPVGARLAAIVLTGYAGGDTRAFVGVMAGPQFTVPASQAVFRVGEIDGYALFGTAVDVPQVGANLLPVMGAGALSRGFTAPLAGGPYTFWFDQLGPPTDISMRFEVSAVPEPAMAALVAFGLPLLGAAARAARKEQR